MAIADRLNGASEAWRPDLDGNDHPNPLVGKVVEVDQGESSYGTFPVVFITAEDGNEWRWSVLGGVAQKRIAKLQPSVGDEIGIRYLGKKPSPNYAGKFYADWKIVLEKGDGTAPPPPDWDAIAEAADDDF
jgi:hypothetical protein